MNEAMMQNMAAAKWALLWQPLYAAHPAPWYTVEHNDTIIVRDANNNMVVQYNQHSHPELMADDRRHNAGVLVAVINNF